MLCRPIILAKFVGTFSLGLLTGTGFTTSLLTLGAILPALPSASLAADALRNVAHRTTRLQSYLSAISFSSLLLAYYLSPARLRHPYLLYATVLGVAPWLVEYAAGGVSPASAMTAGRLGGRGQKVQLVDHTDSSSSSPSASPHPASAKESRAGISDSDEEWGKVSRMAKSTSDSPSASAGSIAPSDSATGKPGAALEDRPSRTARGGISTPDYDDDEEEEYDDLNGEVVAQRIAAWNRWLVGRSLVWSLGWSIMVVGIWGDAA